MIVSSENYKLMRFFNIIDFVIRVTHADTTHIKCQFEKGSFFPYTHTLNIGHMLHFGVRDLQI